MPGAGLGNWLCDYTDGEQQEMGWGVQRFPV